MTQTWRILAGNVLDTLASVPSGSVQACVTSPPYWGLRDYGTATWDGGDPACDHKRKPGGTGGDPKYGPNKGQAGGSPTPMGQTCIYCGARRIDAQIGLEPTPGEYVTRMVEVFSEVRRVLRDDGTLWLNLGDSYANTGAADSSKVGGFTGARIRAGAKGIMDSRPRKIPDGLKPKDLVGIPWSVAKALQAPFYAGTIKDERDRIWLAAMVDAEGCLFIHRRKAGQHNGQGYYRQNDNYGPGVEIANTSLAVVERVMALVGKGSICSQGPEQNGRRRQTLYRWNLRTTESRDFVREVYPYLVAKQHQARLLYGCPASGDKAAAAHEALKALHRGEGTSVDFDAPPSLYEQGYYLRSDIIWAKLNPMPESVTDRPTKSHEYLFLLTKSARYYYDAAAIAEMALVGDCGSSFTKGKTGQKNITAVGQGERVDDGKRNKRSVWTVATQPYPEAHFATYPEALIEPCILAGSKPDDLVLDPFTGSGTTGAVAIRHGRNFLGCELNPAYVELARKRIGAVAPLLAREVA